MKIRCNTCEHLADRKCKVINVSVSPNKSRICEHYDRNEATGSKSQRQIHTVKALPHEIGKSKVVNNSKHRPKSSNRFVENKHPLTGDLSRFIKSSATKQGD